MACWLPHGKVLLHNIIPLRSFLSQFFFLFFMIKLWYASKTSFVVHNGCRVRNIWLRNVWKLLYCWCLLTQPSEICCLTILVGNNIFVSVAMVSLSLMLVPLIIYDSHKPYQQCSFSIFYRWCVIMIVSACHSIMSMLFFSF